jgi:hypothetical protein
MSAMTRSKTGTIRGSGFRSMPTATRHRRTHSLAWGWRWGPTRTAPDATCASALPNSHHGSRSRNASSAASRRSRVTQLARAALTSWSRPRRRSSTVKNRGLDPAALKELYSEHEVVIAVWRSPDAPGHGFLTLKGVEHLSEQAKRGARKTYTATMTAIPCTNKEHAELLRQAFH